MIWLDFLTYFSLFYFFVSVLTLVVSVLVPKYREYVGIRKYERDKEGLVKERPQQVEDLGNSPDKTKGVNLTSLVQGIVTVSITCAVATTVLNSMKENIQTSGNVSSTPVTTVLAISNTLPTMGAVIIIAIVVGIILGAFSAFHR